MNLFDVVVVPFSNFNVSPASFYKWHPLLGSLVCLRVSYSHLCYLYACGGRSLVFLLSFRDFQKPLSCLLPELQELPYGGNISPPLRKLCSLAFSNILCLYKLPPRQSFNSRGNIYSTHKRTLKFQRTLTIDSSLEGIHDVPYQNSFSERSNILNSPTQGYCLLICITTLNTHVHVPYHHNSTFLVLTLILHMQIFQVSIFMCQGSFFEVFLCCYMSFDVVAIPSFQSHSIKPVCHN